MEMNPSEALELVRESIKSQEPIMLIGPPGIGKTDMVNQAAAAVSADVISFHGVTSDPTDAKGMPWVYKEPAGGVRAEFVPFGDLEALIKADHPTVALLDDAGQAPVLVQASWMQMVQSRCIGTHKISPHVSFIAATNRKQDKAGVSGILEPVKSRFTLINVVPHLDSWIAWALGAQLPVEIIAFARFRPECILDYRPTADLTNSACPRTMHKAANWITKGLSPMAELAALSGCIGEGRAAELVGFLKVWRTLPNIDQIIMSPKTAPIPPQEEPATLYAVAGLLGRRATPGNFGAICQYLGRLPKDHQILVMKIATSRAPEVMATQAFIEWSSKNQDVLM